MSKDKTQLLSPLFLKYQADYEKNPRSRVFAPLAEIYRKLAMTDKAMEILAQGIRFHPTYVMGYLGLAFCYYDLKQFHLAYNTLRPLVEANRDNIRLQKLFADVCLELDHKDEALDTYKYLLFINPRDKEVALRVSNLEKMIEEAYRPVHHPIYIPESEFSSERMDADNEQQLFDIDKLDNKPKASKIDFDDWMALDLSRDQKTTKELDPHDFWNVKKGDTPVVLPTKADVIHEEIKPTESNHQPVVELSFDDDEEEEDQQTPSSSEVPLVTHTIVDLYCGQGHIEKALEVLEKILILNPNDERTIKKIAEIKALMGPYEEQNVAQPAVTPAPPPAKAQLDVLKETSEEDGRKNLMEIFDQQVGQLEIEEPEEVDEVQSIIASNSDKIRQIEEKLTQFLKKIQKRALDYQARV